jgi:chromosomal replication initiator protein
MNSTADKTGRKPCFSWVPPRFIVLRENRSAVLAVRRLARNSGTRCTPFIPLLLHGPSGSGKSHLANALYDLIAPKRPTSRIESSAWPRHEDRPLLEWRFSELLVIEDLQHLPAWTSDSLAAILDERRARGLATLITANRGPAELASLPSRLTGRLTAGLVVKMSLPDVAGRRQMLARMLVKRQITVSDEVLNWLAINTPGSGRQLLAAAARLESLAIASPDLDAVRPLFQPELDMRRPTLENIVRSVAARFGLEGRQLRSLDRHPGIVWPRQLSMHLARSSMGLPLAGIGEYFGRDHSTVRYACAKVEKKLARDGELREVLRELAAEI